MSAPKNVPSYAAACRSGLSPSDGERTRQWHEMPQQNATPVQKAHFRKADGPRSLPRPSRRSSAAEQAQSHQRDHYEQTNEKDVEQTRVETDTSTPTQVQKPSREDGLATSRAQTPNPFQTPKTSRKEECVYVLTLSTTPSISQPLNQMREMYFPSHLNKIPAHITLFHALPHSQYPTINHTISTLAESTRPYHITTGQPFRMRKGVAVLLGEGGEQTQSIRQEMLFEWTGDQAHISGRAQTPKDNWLSQQDTSTRWQPHWTVMNKVEEEKKVKKSFDEVRRRLCEEAEHGRATGLVLWRYVSGGDWKLEREYSFEAGTDTTPAEGRRNRVGCFEVNKKKVEDGDSGLKSLETMKKAGSMAKGAWKSMKIGARGPRVDEVK